MAREIPHLTDRQISNYWLKVDKRGPDDCWYWTGSIDRKGYGQIRAFNTLIYAHRLAVVLDGRDPGECALHKCDTPLCCNPSHIFAGDRKANALDAISKGRNSRGMVHGHSKLTDDDVRAIRASDEPGRVLSARHGISQGCVSMVRNRKSWRHVV